MTVQLKLQGEALCMSSAPLESTRVVHTKARLSMCGSPRLVTIRNILTSRNKAVRYVAIPEAVEVEDMVASQFLVAGRLSHLFSADDADVVAPLQILWCRIREALVHVGGDTPTQTNTGQLGLYLLNCFRVLLQTWQRISCATQQKLLQTWRTALCKINEHPAA